MRQWETVLRAGFVQFGEVDADSSLAVFLFKYDRICEPVRIFCLGDGADP